MRLTRVASRALFDVPTGYIIVALASHMALFDDFVLVVKAVNLPPIRWPLRAMSCSRRVI
jgi:hypothetical protein